jgi:DNA-binding PadR family transcriptional regulator
VAQLNGTQASLLGFLQAGPRSGWELLQQIAAGLGRFWNVTPSHAYRELKALEQQGLIEAGEPGPRERRPFTITAKGRRAFASWLDTEPGPEQIRFPLLISLWFGDGLDPARLAQFVDGQRRVRRERLAQYRKARAALGPGAAQRHRRAVVQFGIRYERAILAWLDEIDEPPRRRR